MDLETIKQRIRDLKTKTTARGCTEAEAIAAAAKVADLMSKYDLSAGDVEFGEGRTKTKTKGHSPRDLLYRWIATFTNTAPIIDGEYFVFVGRPHYVEIACYLKTVLDRALDRAIREQKKTAQYRRFRKTVSKRAYIHDFTVGMIARLGKKLTELFAGARNEGEIKAAIAHRDSANQLAPIRPRKETKHKIDHRAWYAGTRAGEDVNLHHAADGSSDQPLTLGGRAK